MGHSREGRTVIVGAAGGGAGRAGARHLPEGDGRRAEMIAGTPLGCISEAEEAAEATPCLALPAASSVSGRILAGDGGQPVRDPLASPER